MTAPTQPAAPTGNPAGYVSPLPEARPHLGHAIASEWTKMTSVRSTVWTLGSMVALVAGIGLFAVTRTTSIDYVNMPFTGPALFGLLVGQLSVMTLGVLTITSEHGTGLIRTTFTAAPDRFRVLTAKYVVLAGVTFTAVAGSVAVVGLTAAVLHNHAPAGVHDLRAELVGGLGGSLYVTLLGVLALAVGTLVRHSAGGVVAMLGIVLLPPLFGGMFSIWEALEPVGVLFLRYNAPAALMQLFGLPNTDVATTPGDWVHMALLVVLTGTAVAFSYVTTGRRDV
ncbi:ABC transporter permease [Streptomyces bambusae]|uniref:ABC transporter permease n=1 Tax=Streptomyces bambusae TaxID=1550616 RepID=A0ABS6ZBB8_9ACTN|nr:ABC transporter permease [Streptomyces bambusae]MBW5485012.1 ABC transporter permease [Streptomyces bambusae]